MVVYGSPEIAGWLGKVRYSGDARTAAQPTPRHLRAFRPVEHLPEVIRDLAVHGQAVLNFQIWEIRPDDGHRGVSGPGIDWEVDRDRP